MKKVILFIQILISLFFSYTFLSGQVPVIDKERCFGGNDWDIPYSLEITNDGGYIVLGSSESLDGEVYGNHGSKDLWVVKFNSEFDTIWTKCLGGSEREWADNIVQTQDSGYILCADTYSTDGDVHGNHGETDVWLVKLDAQGDTLWTRCYGGSASDWSNRIITLEDSGYLVCGGVRSNDGDVHGNHGQPDIWVLRLNSNGDTLWTKCYGGTAYDRAEILIRTNDNCYIMAGCSSSDDGDVHGNQGLIDYYIIKINDTGDTLWTRCYGGSDNECIYDIKQTADNGFIVTGYTKSDDGDVHGQHGDYDAWVMKLNETGELEWEKCLGGTSSEYTTKTLETSDGGYIFAGYTQSSDGDVHGNHGESDSWLIKVDSQGDTLWTKCYGGTYYDEIQDILATDSGFVFAGYSDSEDGDVLSERFEGHDYWMVRLIIPEIPELPDELSLQENRIRIYPNPTLGNLKVECPELKELRIYNSPGNLKLVACSHDVDLTAYPAGIYFVSVTDINGKIVTTKLTLLK